MKNIKLLDNTRRAFCATIISLSAFIPVCIQAQNSSPYIGEVADNHVKVKNVGMGDVVWKKNSFWGERFELAYHTVIPSEYKFFMKQSEDNFRKVSGKMDLGSGSFGTNWQDGDYYKWLEAQIAYYSVYPSDSLLKKINSAASLIAEAQDKDGYITTHRQIGFGLQGPNLVDVRKVIHDKPYFTVRNYHETYNMGHLLTLACTHYRVTKSKLLLNVAVKVAECLDNNFKEITPQLSAADFNPTQIMGLVELYRCTKNKKFLDLANRFISARGNAHTQFYQNATPLREQKHAVGHAVTGTVLYNGAADYCAETGDGKLMNSLEQIWKDIYYRKASLTAGLGNAHDEIDQTGETGTVHEAFGLPYDLFSASAYNETCATLYGAYFCWRMFLLTGDSKYVDQMEVAFYNNLSAISLEGDSFFYTNPLRWYGKDHPLRSLDHHHRWTDEESCVCCPTSMARFLTETNNYAYAVNDTSLFVTLYGSNDISTKVNNQPVTFSQETNYPWNGTVKMIYEENQTSKFNLRLRIPQWAKGSTLLINNKEHVVKNGTFTNLQREWKKGDSVILKLNIEPRVVCANPKVEQLVNQGAIMSGPIVYCVEDIDYSSPFIQFDDLMIPSQPKYNVKYRPQLLGGVNLITIPTIKYQTQSFSKDQLYDSNTSTIKKTQLTFIPYYAWNNRGESRMTVFLPIKW